MNTFLFVCSLNRLRSPTAEHVARRRGYLADSAGLDPSAVRPLTRAAIDRAEWIVCMEERHAHHVRKLAPERAAHILVWAIPDRYGYGAPALQRILKNRLLAFEGSHPHSN